jgi:hypothetical protein
MLLFTDDEFGFFPEATPSLCRLLVMESVGTLFAGQKWRES